MSDEAFARRFYSDRAELTALGVPLQSQRDEFTGEELYTLRSEHYFLDRLELDDDELAALQTALYYLEGKFAYAEPLRLALQNLALGRAGFSRATDRDRRARACERSGLLARARGTTREARVGDLEAAHGEVRLLEPKRRARPVERTMNPYALRLDDGNWYVVGHDLDRQARCARSRSRASAATSASRLAVSATSASRRTSTSSSTGSLARGRSARSSGRARIAVSERHGVVDRAHARGRRDGRRRRLRDGLLQRRAPRRLGAAPERPGRAARARRARGLGCSRRSPASSEAHDGDPPTGRRAEAHRPPAAASRAAVRPSGARAVRRPPGAPCPSPRVVRRRALGGARRRRSSQPGSPSRSRSCRITSRSSTSSTSAAAATPSTPSMTATSVRVEKELYGDVFRRPPEAHAARGSSDPPRDRVRRPDDRGRGAHVRSSACARSSRRPSVASSSPEHRSRAMRPPRRRS